MSRNILLTKNLHYFLDCKISLQGGREVSDFIEFIKKNASNQPVTVARGEEEEVKEEKKKKKKSKKEEL